MIPYGRHQISTADCEAVLRVLHSDYLTTGPEVPALEHAWQEKFQAKRAIACSSGTTALELLAEALGVNGRWRVYVPAVTFSASAAAFVRRGARLCVVDVDQKGLIDMDHLGQLLSQAPANDPYLVVPVHLAGRPVDMHRLARLVNPEQIIEDACHAAGARYSDERPVGSCECSRAAVFSLHPVKHIAAGEGGMICTNDAELADRLRLQVHHGVERDTSHFPQDARTSHGEPLTWYHQVMQPGTNARLSDIAAALAHSQLDALEQSLGNRRALAAEYRQQFGRIDAVQLTWNSVDEARHAFHLAPVLIDFRNHDERHGLMMELRRAGIGTQVHYIPLPLHPAYGGWTLQQLDRELPGAATYYARTLSLPMYAGLQSEQQRHVIREFGALVRQMLSNRRPSC